MWLTLSSKVYQTVQDDLALQKRADAITEAAKLQDQQSKLNTKVMLQVDRSVQNLRRNMELTNAFYDREESRRMVKARIEHAKTSEKKQAEKYAHHESEQNRRLSHY